MRDRDYIVIQAPMVSKLSLSGNNLIIFALIHGYTKDGVHKFTGSIDYICKWTNLSRPSVIATLKALTLNGFINKEEEVVKGVKFCAYTTNYDALVEGAALTLQNVFVGLECGQIKAVDEKGREYLLKCDFTARQKAILKAGGLLSYTREGGI